MPGKKHIFLLDDNIIEYGVKGTNKAGQSDLTCMELLVKIGRNCHKILVWPELNKKAHMYLDHGKKGCLPVALTNFINHLVRHEDKWHEHIFSASYFDDGFLQGQYPRKDEHIVKEALIFERNYLPEIADEYATIYIVTEDDNFFEAMQQSEELLETQIIPCRSSEALVFSKRLGK